MTEIEWREKFSARLVDILELRKIKQRQLADLVGLHEVSISHYINCRKTVPLMTVLKMAEVLECPVSELIDFKECEDYGDEPDNKHIHGETIKQVKDCAWNILDNAESIVGYERGLGNLSITIRVASEHEPYIDIHKEITLINK